MKIMPYETSTCTAIVGELLVWHLFCRTWEVGKRKKIIINTVIFHALSYNTAKNWPSMCYGNLEDANEFYIGVTYEKYIAEATREVSNS